MKQVTVDIPAENYPIFVNLIKSLSYIKGLKMANAEKNEVIKGLHEAVKEVKQIKSGKKKPVLLNDFLNEL